MDANGSGARSSDRRAVRSLVLRSGLAVAIWTAALLPASHALGQQVAPPVEPPDAAAPEKPEGDAQIELAKPDETPAEPDIAEPRWVIASPLTLRYMGSGVGLPPVTELLEVTFELAETPEGLALPAPDQPSTTYTLAQLCDGSKRVLSVQAVERICAAVYSVLNDRGFVGVLVAPDPDRIDWQTRDVFDTDESTLYLNIYVAVVGQIRTVASGDRIREADRVNSAKHAAILRRSPIKTDAEDPERAYIQRREIDDFVLRLNRHPGRRVDVAIAPTESRDKAVLDYLVSENKPLTLYAQLSNTGTEDTDVWRERFGFTHTQLTGRDDILSVDYITAGFSEAHAVIASYDTPIFDAEKLRLRIYGNFSSFEASDVGLANEQFSGDSWTLGAELVWNLLQTSMPGRAQDRALFVDAFGGARWQNIKVNNEFADVKGEDDVFLPRVGLRAESRNDVESLGASVAVEWSMPGVSGSDPEELEKLGRLNVDEEWVTLQFDVGYSFFLEPLLNAEEWRKPRVPTPRGDATRFDPGLSTLAHELVFGVRGQWAFDNRLIPNAEQVVGGLYTVRGYPESVVAGDSVIIGTVEYRFHLPRALSIQPEPSRLFGREFRMRPQQQFGRPDWDLVLRAFVDAAHVVNSDREDYEKDESLIGAGLGAELLLYQNLSARMDWGMALDEVDNQNVKRGSNRFHFVFTILF
ncbi:MAG: ShlB/FhaC/HecB family hemolysin secretion/activation protein [Phycisphaeraceae bacterium]|nr:MAG: ShlB/FhaC/HecB family hemolysin secretion/activation protein [Phycisphaeraceae bacterium]